MVELVWACVGADEGSDPLEMSGIFGMNVHVSSAISVPNSDCFDIVANNMSDSCLHLFFLPSSAWGHEGGVGGWYLSHLIWR